MHKSYNILIRLRARLLVFLTHNMVLPVLRFVRKPQPITFTAGELCNFPAGTLGFDLTRFLEQKYLKLLPYHARHDIKHILLEYDTTDEGEVCLQCFILGNEHISFPVAATVLFGFVIMPEFWTKFRRAFIRGRKSNGIKNRNWFNIIEESTESLIFKINQHEKN